ncbi:DUF5994 family protein [Mycobacterium sp. 852013-51886_SCH5428379]|uniref:DUF5994 family protein n=1 Tax=Mycobacterium sp. 852013-51886_SCH5428379 TaxID=1834111 RepID=UPI000AFB298D|nr:DUF5994 family protein [Mycobacterium sp. 852013-51886_SCH5428379]
MTITSERPRIDVTRTGHRPAAQPRVAQDLRRRRRSQIATLRLRLKPGHRVCGHVQGGWWPRSEMLVGELPPLLDALARRYGRIASVSVHPHEWSAVPAHMELPEIGRVPVDATAETPHIITLTGPRMGRLDLLVVPPYTDAEEAYRIVTAAATATNVATPEELLGEHYRGEPAMFDAQLALSRWECEGGAPAPL